MIIDKKREARQLLGIDKLEKNNYNGILAYCPGVGKTYTAQLGIKRIENSFPNSSYLIIVPNEILKKQWENKNKVLPKTIQNRTIVETATTILNNNITYEVTVLIVDELHEYHTDNFMNLLNKSVIKNTYFIGLSGTTGDKNFYKIKKLYPIVDSITFTEAKELGFVADVIEYNLAINLTPKEYESYDYFSAIIDSLLPKFDNNLDIVNKIVLGAKDKNGFYYSGVGWARAFAIKKGWRPDFNFNLDNFKKIDEIWNPSILIANAKKLLHFIRLRKDLLTTAKNKYEITIDILKKFNTVKTILFSESVVFAEQITEELNKNNIKTCVYHSSLKTKLAPGKTGKLIKFGAGRQKKEALDKLINGNIKVLSTARALDKGLDIPDIRMSVTTSGSSNITQYVQRTGRVTRKEIDNEQPVLCINLYAINTQDEKWLKSRQYSIQHIVNWISSVDEITYNPPESKFIEL